MTHCTTSEHTYTAQSVSLSDLERLWGDAGQHALADETLRTHYREHGCPLPPPPPPPADELAWHQPPCA
ncbi:MAG: hypothetical protein HGA19_10440 [Oscillochloris sp.]|nr:hypothetical protein [Oscillochloris sp.]